MKRLPLLAILFALSGCGGSSSSSPAAPTPPTPILSLVLMPDGSPGVQTITLKDMGRNWWHSDQSYIVEDEIVIGIHAENEKRVTGLGGTLMWDGDKLEYSGWAEGPFLKQNGSLVKWDFSRSSSSDRIIFYLDLPSTSASINGSGDIIYVYLKRKANFTTGTTPLQWDNPVLGRQGCDIMREDCSYLWSTKFYGGTISVVTR